MKLNKTRQLLADQFIESLKEDTIPWRQGWNGGSKPQNAISHKDYHGVNLLLLSYISFKKEYADPRWCTYKQAKDNDWQVKKGEKGVPIEFWSLYDTKMKQKLSQAEADKLKKSLSVDELKERIRPLSSTYTVFNAAQIDGMPELERKEQKLDETMLVKYRDNLLKNMNLGFIEQGWKSFYIPDKDMISLPQLQDFESEYSYMSTFLHEAAHATGHKSRLNRDMYNSFGSTEYAKEELRAEIASTFTTQDMNLPSSDNKAHLDNHKAYIQNWISILDKNPDELFAAIKEAGKISDYLIEKGEFDKFKYIEKDISPENALGGSKLVQNDKVQGNPLLSKENANMSKLKPLSSISSQRTNPIHQAVDESRSQENSTSMEM